VVETAVTTLYRREQVAIFCVVAQTGPETA
jgi:hypothetical protein